MKLALPTLLIAAAVLGTSNAKPERRRKHRVLQEETTVEEAPTAESALPDEDPENTWIYVPPTPPYHSPPPPAPKPYYPKPPPYVPPPDPPMSGPCCSWNWATCGTYHPFCNANPYQCEDGCDGYWIHDVVQPPKYGPPTCIPLWGQCEPPHLPYGGTYNYKPQPPPCCGPEPPCTIMGTSVPCLAGTVGCACPEPPPHGGGRALEEGPEGDYGGHGGGYGDPCLQGDMGCDPCPHGAYGCKPYVPPPPHPSDQYPVCHDYGGGFAQCVPAHQVYNKGYYYGGGIEEDEVAAFLMNSLSFSMADTEAEDGGEIEFGKRN